MSDSLKNIDVSFTEKKQVRAKKTLEDLMQAAIDLTNTANPKLLTSRNLSVKSGYALGTLVKHLNKIDNIFLWAIIKGRTQNIEKFCRTIESHDPKQPLRLLIEKMVDQAFIEIQRVNPAIIRYFQSKAFKRAEAPWELNQYTDVIAKYWIKAINDDLTGTFRRMTEEEVVWVLRTSLVFVEHPFVEKSAIAGTAFHKELATENLLRLLATGG